MADIERIQFDFRGDGGLEAADKLEDILRSDHWSGRGLNYEDERTKLLLHLLQIGGIAVYKRPYDRKANEPEIRRRANEFNMFMNKRHVGQALLDIAGIFFSYEYDCRKTIYNSLYFPELKAFVRCDGLPPDRLLELLEQDECEAVMLFPAAQTEDGDMFCVFTLAMPKEMYLESLEEMRQRTMEAMHESARKIEAANGSIIPKYPAETE